MGRDASPEAGREGAPRAVLLDALGTLVELDRPVERLVAALGARGIAASPGATALALRAEVAHYRAHHDSARDEASLQALRDACAAVFHAALPEASGADAGDVRDALLEGLRFRAFDEVPGVLAGLRAQGARLVVVSNWDVSLHGVLRETGLADLVDGVLTSAEEGVAKPGPEIFRRALALAGGVPPEAALHAGDDVAADVRGAQAAGIAAVLVDRDGSLAAPPGVRVARTLADLLGDAR